MEFITKICTKCGERKSLEEYHRSARGSHGKQPKCKACTKTYSRKWYDAGGKQKTLAHQKEYVNDRRHKLCEYLSEHPCIDCGESDIVVLEFDHLHSKEANISEMVMWGYAWNRIYQEILKCEVVCANCHRRRTANRAQNFKVGFKAL